VERPFFGGFLFVLFLLFFHVVFRDGKQKSSSLRPTLLVSFFPFARSHDLECGLIQFWQTLEIANVDLAGTVAQLKTLIASSTSIAPATQRKRVYLVCILLLYRHNAAQASLLTLVQGWCLVAVCWKTATHSPRMASTLAVSPEQPVWVEVLSVWFLGRLWSGWPTA
jgi:hypothetical protein